MARVNNLHTLSAAQGVLGQIIGESLKFHNLSMKLRRLGPFSNVTEDSQRITQNTWVCSLCKAKIEGPYDFIVKSKSLLREVRRTYSATSRAFAPDAL